MIKPIDMPAVMQRSVDMVSAQQGQLMRGELAGEFANRMGRQDVEQMVKTVTQAEKAEGKRISEQEERRRGQQRDEEDPQQQKKKGQQGMPMPNFGYESKKKLDISI